MKALQISYGLLSKEIIIGRTSSRLIGLSCFIILTALGAYVRIPLPFTPVPVTLQTFFVLLSGAVLGRKWAAASQAGYLFLGALGLPIFTGAGSGIAFLFGPTGGYLIGFVLSGWIVGGMTQGENHQTTIRTILAMIIGSLAGIYLFGLVGLSLFLRCNLSQALALGFFPFILGDAIKIICAAFIFSKIKKRCGEVFGLR